MALMKFTRCILLLSTALTVLICMGSAMSGERPKRASFAGVWSMMRCERGQPEYECATFYLYLTQKDDRICGEHFVATQGLSKLDEGDPGTVLGVVKGKSTTFMIRSTRNDAWYVAEGNMVGRQLIWRRIGMMIPGSNDEPPVIPANATLSKNSTPKLLEHLKEIESMPCVWPDQN